MSKIIIDSATASILQSQTGRVELCDDSGRTLGYFTPRQDRSLYEGVEIPFTEEELRQAEQATERYTTEEVLAYLKSLEKS
ncbi:MAG TPA: hypothetical protein VF590_06345 [Isosphaeraceae bacterium]|jgi:hypothetical protein